MNKFTKIFITNAFTMIRVIGIFLMLPFFYIYGGKITAILCAICFFSDFIDGYLARKLQSSTFFGSLFDSVSDKLFLVVNLVMLISVTKLAIAIIVLELCIALVQFLKYYHNFNVHANIIGKLKMWFAGIIITITYFLVDQNLSSNTYNLVILPLIIIEILTLLSYIWEYFINKSKISMKEVEKRKKHEQKLAKEIGNIGWKKLMFEPDIYAKYKNEGNLKLVKSLATKKKYEK